MGVPLLRLRRCMGVGRLDQSKPRRPGSSSLAPENLCILEGLRVWPGMAARNRSSLANLGNTIALLDWRGAVVDSGEHLGRVTRYHDVNDGWPIAFLHALLKRGSERLRVFDANAPAAHRAGDRRVIHLLEVGRLVTSPHHRVLQCFDVAGGAVVDNDDSQAAADEPRGFQLAERRVE